MNLTWLELVVYGLACWRLSTLLGEDAGPYRFLAKIRSFLKREAKHNRQLRKSAIHEGVDCRRCNSIWFASLLAPFAYWHDYLWPWLATTGDVMLLLLALSAIAILVDRALPSG